MEIKALLNNTTYSIEFANDDLNKGIINGKEFELDVASSNSIQRSILYNNRSYNVEVLSFDAAAKSAVVKVNNVVREILLKDKFDELLEKMGMSAAASNKVKELKAPMPGLVLAIRVKEGDEVKKGDPLVVLEAMKMENIIKSPADVVVNKITVKQGQAVEKNEILIQFAS
jgi:biotin carboxyl carrier protein